MDTEGVTKNPTVCGGKPCISGTRIPLDEIASLRRRGIGIEKLMEMYPVLNREEAAGAIEFVDKAAPPVGQLRRGRRGGVLPSRLRD